MQTHSHTPGTHAGLLPPQPRTPWQRLCAYRWFHACAAFIFVTDQLSKCWITHTLPLGSYGAPEHIEIIPGFFNIVHVGNTGAAWSLFAGQSALLALVAAITLIGIFFWRRTLGLHRRLFQITFGLLCGGILGNLIDRIVHKHVIDFLDFHFGNYTYPAFNIADSGICIGAILYIGLTLFAPNAHKKAAP